MKKSVIAALLLFSVFVSQEFGFSQERVTPQGKIIIALERIGEQYAVAEALIVPGVQFKHSGTGNISFAVSGAAGVKLGEGKLFLPRYVYHDRADESGNLTGFRTEIKDAAVLILPYYDSAEEIELRDLHDTVLLKQKMREIPRYFLNRRASRNFPGDIDPPNQIKPDYRGYLTSLLPPERPKPNQLIIEKPNSVRPYPTTTVSGRVEVDGVTNPNLFAAVIAFYNSQDGELVSSVESDGNGEFNIDLEAGRYLVRAWCEYSDPNHPDNAVELYPSPLVVTTYETGSDPLVLRWRLNHLMKGLIKLRNGPPIRGKVYIFENDPSGSTFQRAFVGIIQTGDDGRFAVRLPAGKYPFIVIPDSREAAGELLVIKKVPKNGQRILKFICPPTKEVTAEPLRRIWGSGQTKNKLNLLFLAEAYTDDLESFKDKNGNGRWDGDMLLDENGNGQFDTGEYYFDRDGNGKYNKPEPFKDENGDHICNRFERAKFDFDCAMTTASLLNFKPFDRFANRINVFTYWTPSVHGTQSFIGIRKPWVMETALNVYCSGTGGFQPGNVNSYEVHRLAAQALDDYTIPIVMVHDPINVLRANAVMGFGRILLSAEDSRAGTVFIHEMGHSVASLWDEYIYAEGATYWGGEPGGDNVTCQTDLQKVKWKNFIKGDPPVPTPYGHEGYGIFEGAGYSYGIYRPTANSMMRSTSYPFFRVNEKSLVAVLKSFKKK